MQPNKEIINKTNYYRSPKMMEVVRSLPCANCGAEDGTVCGAHANWSWANKGRGIKADDLVAALCHKCHMQLDQGSTLSRSERESMWLRAFYQTMSEGFKAGVFRI